MCDVFFVAPLINYPQNNVKRDPVPDSPLLSIIAACVNVQRNVALGKRDGWNTLLLPLSTPLLFAPLFFGILLAVYLFIYFFIIADAEKNLSFLLMSV